MLHCVCTPYRITPEEFKALEIVSWTHILRGLLRLDFEIDVRGGNSDSLPLRFKIAAV